MHQHPYWAYRWDRFLKKPQNLGAGQLWTPWRVPGEVGRHSGTPRHSPGPARPLAPVAFRGGWDWGVTFCLATGCTFIRRCIFGTWEPELWFSFRGCPFLQIGEKDRRMWCTPSMSSTAYSFVVLRNTLKNNSYEVLQIFSPLHT